MKENDRAYILVTSIENSDEDVSKFLDCKNSKSAFEIKDLENDLDINCYYSKCYNSFLIKGSSIKVCVKEISYNDKNNDVIKKNFENLFYFLDIKNNKIDKGKILEGFDMFIELLKNCWNYHYKNKYCSFSKKFQEEKSLICIHWGGGQKGIEYAAKINRIISKNRKKEYKFTNMSSTDNLFDKLKSNNEETNIKKALNDYWMKVIGIDEKKSIFELKENLLIEYYREIINNEEITIRKKDKLYNSIEKLNIEKILNNIVNDKKRNNIKDNFNNIVNNMFIKEKEEYKIKQNFNDVRKNFDKLLKEINKFVNIPIYP